MNWLSKCVCGSRQPDSDNNCKYNRRKKNKGSKKKKFQSELLAEGSETNTLNEKCVVLVKGPHSDTSDEKFDNICNDQSGSQRVEQPTRRRNDLSDSTENVNTDGTLFGEKNNNPRATINLNDSVNFPKNKRNNTNPRSKLSVPINVKTPIKLSTKSLQSNDSKKGDHVPSISEKFYIILPIICLRIDQVAT